MNNIHLILNGMILVRSHNYFTKAKSSSCISVVALQRGRTLIELSTNIPLPYAYVSFLHYAHTRMQSIRRALKNVRTVYIIFCPMCYRKDFVWITTTKRVVNHASHFTKKIQKDRGGGVCHQVFHLHIRNFATHLVCAESERMRQTVSNHFERERFGWRDTEYFFLPLNLRYTFLQNIYCLL